MKLFKKLLALTLALMLLLCLCACSQSGQGSTTDSTGSSTGSTEKDPTQGSTGASIPDGMVQYKVRVADEEGNPIAGVMVQVCSDESCTPGKTDDTGVAAVVVAAGGKYHANILSKNIPGYEVNAEVFYYAEGETELTIKLKAVAGSGAN